MLPTDLVNASALHCYCFTALNLYELTADFLHVPIVLECTANLMLPHFTWESQELCNGPRARAVQVALLRTFIPGHATTRTVA